MNIEKLSRKGMKYTKAAIINWKGRSYKLQKAWCLGSEQNSKSPIYLKRCVVMANVLADWIGKAQRRYYDMETQLSEAKAREGETMVKLTCTNDDCLLNRRNAWKQDARTMMVKYSSWEGRPTICPECKSEMELHEEREIQFLIEGIFNGFR